MSARPGAASALSEFLIGGIEQAADPSAPLEKLGLALAQVDAGGLSFTDAMERAKLSRTGFLGALSVGTSAGVLEIVEVDGERKVRLTEDGRSLY